MAVGGGKWYKWRVINRAGRPFLTTRTHYEGAPIVGDVDFANRAVRYWLDKAQRGN